MSTWKMPPKNNDSCSCASSQGLFVTNRLISICISGALFVLCATFITGYFLGKKYHVEHYTQKIADDIFVDTVYTSVVSNAIIEDVADEMGVAEKIKDVPADPCESTSICDQSELASEHNLTKNSDVNKKYYAELIGFGTENAAQQFVKKLAHKGVQVEMKKRISKTARGKKTFWYQVVTMVYEDKSEMQKLIDSVVKEEKLRDVYIRTC